jgi:hypothetical protein
MVANYGPQIICVNGPPIASAVSGRIQSNYPFGPIVEKSVPANALIRIEQTSSWTPKAIGVPNTRNVTLISRRGRQLIVLRWAMDAVRNLGFSRLATGPRGLVEDRPDTVSRRTVATQAGRMELA